jgi:hypothetical protein
MAWLEVQPLAAASGGISAAMTWLAPRVRAAAAVRFNQRDFMMILPPYGRDFVVVVLLDPQSNVPGCDVFLDRSQSPGLI